MLTSPALARPSCLPRVWSRLGRARALAAFTVIAGCGGSTPAPAAAPVAAAAEQEPSIASPLPSGVRARVPSTETAPSAIAAPAAADFPGYDIVKGKDPVHLKPLFEKGATPAFPAATASEQECWRTVGVTGSARQDYETIVAKCGASTGAVQYVKPAVGHLHHKHQRRDVFVVPVQAGLCYRFFGVGDASINDLDILIEKNGGALVGDDKATGPVAIIESDKAWCQERDEVYSFLVQTHGEGHGHYVFGIWARKDTK